MSSFKRIKHRFLNESPIETWDRTLVRLGFKEFTSIEEYIWCLSTGRVGTQTLSALGKLIPNVLSKHEPNPKLFGLGKYAYEDFSDQSHDILCEAIKACRSHVTGLNQTIYLESSPQVTFLARQLYDTFPNSKFIHLVRHPIPVVESGLKRRWYNGNPTDRWRITPSGKKLFGVDWKDVDPFYKNIWSWSETNKWIVNFLKDIPKLSQITLKSEEVFSCDQESIKKFSQFCGVDSINKSVVEKVLSKKLNSSSKSSNINYKWKKSQIDALEKIAGSEMKLFNYSLDHI